MGRTLDEMIDALPSRQQAMVRSRARAVLAQELSLRAFRKALALTQTDVARHLKKGQESSRASNSARICSSRRSRTAWNFWAVSSKSRAGSGIARRCG